VRHTGSLTRDDPPVPEQSVRSRLLIASPDLGDPNFARTVVLMLEHNKEGALGLVLNRPTDATLTEPLPAWAELAAEPAVVFVGGPVQPEAAIGLGRRVEQDPTGDVEGFAALFGNLGTVDLERPPGDVSPPIDRVRVFAGYAGWGAGQLEAELAADGWFVVDATPSDPWVRNAGELWREVLRRQRGPLQVFADFPSDPAQN
jgi:putative transcriptional regulator